MSHILRLRIEQLNVDQDQGDQDGEGQGQVRKVMLCVMCFLSAFSNEKRLSQTLTFDQHGHFQRAKRVLELCKLVQIFDIDHRYSTSKLILILEHSSCN